MFAKILQRKFLFDWLQLCYIFADFKLRKWYIAGFFFKFKINIKWCDKINLMF